jgi:uncharacterized protein YjbI with pentapeptide repeats
MSRTFITAVVVIAILLAVILFVSWSRSPMSEQETAAVPGSGDAVAGGRPEVVQLGNAPGAQGEEVTADGQLVGAEPLGDEVMRRLQERVEAGELPPPLDRQPLLDQIEAAGADNERVLELNGVLRGLDLQKADLKLIDLSDADAAEVNLNDAQLQGADLSRASMPGAKLQGADLTAALLDRIDLRGAQLERATLEASARGADLRGVRLNEASLAGADLTQADLRSTIFHDASVGANFREADLRLTDFTGADFMGADLTDADLEGAILDDVSNLSCDQLQKAQNWATAKRPEDLACGEPRPHSRVNGQ